MKRPIKFRGVASFSREILFGDLVHFNGGDVAIVDDPVRTAVPVEPDSIAQLVGYDRDGREVYEGDILTLEHDGTTYEYAAVLESLARTPDRLIQNIKRLTLKELEP